jgi:hypothetical protein
VSSLHSIPTGILRKSVGYKPYTLSGEIFVGRNYLSDEIFVPNRKIRHFRPTKIFAQ